MNHAWAQDNHVTALETFGFLRELCKDIFLCAHLAFSVRAHRTGRDVLRQYFAGNLIDCRFY